MISFRQTAIAAALGALLVAGCGNPAAPQGNYGTITGTVKSATGQPISGAIVTADLVDNSQPSDVNGKYTITAVPVDSSSTTTQVTCSASGYQTPPAQNVTVSAGKTIEVDFTLTSD
ncbi:MAG TPA: carboxypeptidase-like regulatory domain-containing protein [Candidatus Eremiobacteraceae bacterium]|nr:carboxypeptidase-like regulatory domain-containing protein [Candidatus Eremiobacteraceae bacterium]